MNLAHPDANTAAADCTKGSGHTKRTDCSTPWGAAALKENTMPTEREAACAGADGSATCCIS